MLIDIIDGERSENWLTNTYCEPRYWTNEEIRLKYASVSPLSFIVLFVCLIFYYVYLFCKGMGHIYIYVFIQTYHVLCLYLPTSTLPFLHSSSFLLQLMFLQIHVIYYFIDICVCVLTFAFISVYICVTQDKYTTDNVIFLFLKLT